MPSKLNSLLEAVSNGNPDEVKRCLNEGNANFRDPADGVTLLARAVSGNHIEVVKLLLEKGASMKVADNVGFVPIHRAAWSGTYEMVQLLLDHGADVNAVVDGHYVAAWRAPRDNASAGNSSAERKTPLILAAMRGDVDLVALLTANGADVDHRDGFNMAAIDHAALEGRAEVVDFLLERGSDANAARVLAAYGSDHNAKTVPQRESYNEIAKTLCAVWAPQCRVTVT